MKQHYIQYVRESPNQAYCDRCGRVRFVHNLCRVETRGYAEVICIPCDVDEVLTAFKSGSVWMGW